MEGFEKLVICAQNGDRDAYDRIVRHFQDFAVACGVSALGDFHYAEDAAQEAFLEAFACLPQLREPQAFPGWLRRIVFKHCDRITRKRYVQEVSWEAISEEVSGEQDPHKMLEQQEAARRIQEAIAWLPEHEREVTLLFYMAQHSQAEIAAFLSVPVTTVKKRLHTARKRLKEKVIDMTQENWEEQRPSRNTDFAERVKVFTPQFSQMIDEGQSLVRSLATLAEREPHTDLRRIIAQVQTDLTGDGRKGTTLSEALASHPEAFSQRYVEAIRQGEINGNLKDVLEQLAAR